MAHRNHSPGRWIVAAVVVGVAAIGVWGYLRVMEFESLTTAGKVSATWGLRTLAEREPVDASSSLRVAQRQFSEARSLLGPDWLRGVPWLGRQLQAADELCTIGVEASSAGVEVARLMGRATIAPQQGRLSTLLQLVPTHLDPALVSMTRVAELSEGLTTDGLVPQLAEAVDLVKRPLAQVQPLLRRSQSMLNLERYLFSRQHRFLVVTQDSAELQPTGGSMETYGLISFGPAGFALTTSAEISSLPNDTLNISSPPGKHTAGQHLTFGDANWWMDFPTSATKMAQFWQNLGQPEIDGIVAVDVPMIQNMLDVYGPVSVPETKVPLTATNLMEELTSIGQSHGSGDGKQRAQAVVSLTTELVSLVTDVTSDQLLPTIDSLTRAADEKHIQVYLLNPAAQADMVAVGWAGALDPPEGTTDLVGVSNGDVEPSKANLDVSKSMDYEVKLGPNGAAQTTLTLGYQRTSKKRAGIPEQPWPNYLRVHRFPGTQLTGASKRTFTSPPDPTGVPTFGQFFQLSRGSREVVLRTSLGQVLRQLPAGAGDGPVWQYRLLVAKQADLVDTRATVSITLPRGWHVAGSAASFRVTGRPVATRSDASTVTLTTSLAEDLLLDVVVSSSDGPR